MMNRVEADRFFTQTNCDRCGGSLEVRIMSWFTKETLCLSCREKEDAIKKAMRDKGIDPLKFEGCGYIPTLQEGDRKRVEIGKPYEVTKAGCHLSRTVPDGHCAWTGESKDLRVGDKIMYCGMKMGWGSDNIPIENFSYEGWGQGEFWPNTWGVADKSFLKAIE